MGGIKEFNRMLKQRVSPFSKDRKIKFKGFNNQDFEVEQRWLWCEILIKEIHCDKCGDEERITLHGRDIPKLIKILTKLTKGLYKPKKEGK